MAKCWRLYWCYLPLLIVACDASGFTFSDGTSVGCYASGRLVPENVIDPSPEQLTFTGKAVQVNSAYQIMWNEPKLKALPPEVHDYIFFHECAHAKVPTPDELTANCEGLKDMRAAGRAGAVVEGKLAAFYGPGSTYWSRTLKCANGEAY